MRCLFLDDTALVKLVLSESGSDYVRALHAPGRGIQLATSRHALVEAASTLYERARESDVAEIVARDMCRGLYDLIEARYSALEPSSESVLIAFKMLSNHTVTSSEAMQLAMLSQLKRTRRGLSVMLVSANERMNEAARALEIDVRDPTQPAM